MARDFNLYVATATGRVVAPAIGYKKVTKPSVNIARFGDGYSQRVGQYIANHAEEWSVSYVNQPSAAIEAIVAFLKSPLTGNDETEAGVHYFLWTPPDTSIPVKVICSDWEIEYTSHFSQTLTTKFTRVYDLY